MSPLSAIAVTRLAGHTVAVASRATTQAVEQFADVFAGLASGAEAGSADQAPAVQAADSDGPGARLQKIAGTIVDRIRHLLDGASLPASGPLSLELSPLGGLYVSGESDQRGSIETALAHDVQLRELLGRWSSLSGERSFAYSGDDSGVGDLPLGLPPQRPARLSRS